MNQQPMEVRIKVLLNGFRSGLSPVAVVEVEEYLKHDEWGLALDTLIALLVKADTAVTAAQHAEILDLHDAMELDPDQSQWIRALKISPSLEV